MITVTVTKQGNFPVNTKRVKEIVKKTLGQNGIVSDADVDVAIVSESKMDELNDLYYQDKTYEHPIFTFPQAETGEFVFPPDGKMHLGQIVISYQQAVVTAREENKLIDDVVNELAEHGSLHLVGIHH